MCHVLTVEYPGDENEGMTVTCKNIGGCDKYNVDRKKYSPKE